MVSTSLFQGDNAGSNPTRATKEIIMKWKNCEVDIQTSWPPKRKVKALVCKVKGHDFEEKGRGRTGFLVHRHLVCLRCGYEANGFLKGFKRS